MPEGLYSARVQRRLPGVETTEIEVHMATYSLIAGSPQAVQIYNGGKGHA